MIYYRTSDGLHNYARVVVEPDPIDNNFNYADFEVFLDDEEVEHDFAPYRM